MNLCLKHENLMFSIAFKGNARYVLTISFAPNEFLWSIYMVNFEAYIARHGEFGVQALVERWERYQGIRVSIDTPLEARWVAFMGNDNFPSPAQQQRMAA
jgi:hypothetical protein